MEEIRFILTEAYKNNDTEFMEKMLEYSNGYARDFIEEFLPYSLLICPSCFKKIKPYSNSEVRGYQGVMPLIEHLTFHECNNCGWNK